MAISIAKYSSVNTKVRALYGKLLTKHDYEELLDKKTVQNVAEYLKKNTSYSEMLSEVDENLVHRGELEKLFRISLYGDFIKLFRFTSGNAKEFLKTVFLRYEVEDLKMLFRVIYTHRESEASGNLFIFLKQYSNLDFDVLFNLKSVTQLISSLKGSEYFKAFSPITSGSGEPNLFDIEMSLDLHFFMKILKLKDKLLSGADRRSITHTFGIEIDVLNILMIYRCKKLFKLPPELTYKYVIPHWFRLTRDELIRLTRCQDVDEFKKLLQKTKYKDIFNSDEEHRWEINSMNYLHKVYKGHFRKDYHNFGMAMAYLHLKEMDIRNIITLIEGIRYSLPKEEIKSYLAGIGM